MKYTRYNYKKNKGTGFNVIFILAVIVFLAFIIGTITSNFFIKDKIMKNDEVGNPVQEENKESSPKDIKDIKLYAVQCGYFSEKVNADQLKDKLKENYNVFYYIDSGKTRVLVGIYDEERAEPVIKDIKGKGFDCAKISFAFPRKNQVDSEVGEIFDAHRKLINKLEERDTKLIQTAYIKKWTKELKEVEGDSPNLELLKELKEYTLNLPEEVTKDTLEEYQCKIFTMMKKFKS